MAEEQTTDTIKKLICLGAKLKRVKLDDDGGDHMAKKGTIRIEGRDYDYDGDVDENMADDVVKKLSSKMKKTSLLDRQDSVLDYLRARQKTRKKKRRNRPSGLILEVSY